MTKRRNDVSLEVINRIYLIKKTISSLLTALLK